MDSGVNSSRDGSSSSSNLVGGGGATQKKKEDGTGLKRETLDDFFVQIQPYKKV